MRHEVFEYLLSVVDHAFFWFGGIALVIVEALKKVPRTKEWAERLRGEFWAIAALCIFIATFQAWHDEFKGVETLNSSNSQLTGENKILKQTNVELISKLMEKERPIIVQAAPDPEIQRLLRRQDEELAKLKSEMPSPKKKALQLSNDILKFLGDRMKVQPGTPELMGATKDQWEQKMNEYTRNYVTWMNETAAEYQIRFGARVSSVSDDMQSAGLNTANIQMCVFSNGNTFGIQECGARIGALAEKLPR